jgi:hypothetical protein
MNDVELFWATIVVPFENYRRQQRVRIARSVRNAELAVNGYLKFDWFDVSALMEDDRGSEGSD